MHPQRQKCKALHAEGDASRTRPRAPLSRERLTLRGIPLLNQSKPRASRHTVPMISRRAMLRG